MLFQIKFIWQPLQSVRQPTRMSHDDWLALPPISAKNKTISLSINMEGELHGCPLFEQVAVIREVDLHYIGLRFVHRP